MSDANAIPAFDTPRTLGSYALNSVQNVDLFTLCDGLPEASVDMILCDLPYGTTACAWDTVIPFEPLWARFKRVIKPRGAIVLTARQPFASALVTSNIGWFWEELVWDKIAATGYLDANRKHMKSHENIYVFCDGQPTFNPQKTVGKPYVHIPRSSNFEGYNDVNSTPTISEGGRYPKSIITESASTQAYKRLHPTQKPEPLFQYLIRTYTHLDEFVLDPCVGSGTTAIAARAEARQFICGDNGTDTNTGRLWADIANERLALPFTLPLFQERNS